MDRERLSRFSTLVDTDSDDDVRDTMVDESPGRWALGGGGPKGWEPEPRKSGGPQRVGGPKFRAFFFPSPAANFIHFGIAAAVQGHGPPKMRVSVGVMFPWRSSKLRNQCDLWFPRPVRSLCMESVSVICRPDFPLRMWPECVRPRTFIRQCPLLLAGTMHLGGRSA